MTGIGANTAESKKSWDDRDYDFGLYLAEVASFEALGHTEDVTPYLVCKQCADEAKKEGAPSDWTKKEVKDNPVSDD